MAKNKLLLVTLISLSVGKAIGMQTGENFPTITNTYFVPQNKTLFSGELIALEVQNTMMLTSMYNHARIENIKSKLLSDLEKETAAYNRSLERKKSINDSVCRSSRVIAKRKQADLEKENNPNNKDSKSKKKRRLN